MKLPLIAITISMLASPAFAEVLSCDAIKGDCLQRGVSPAVCSRNMASAHLTGYWPAFRRGNIRIPPRACK